MISGENLESLVGLEARRRQQQHGGGDLTIAPPSYWLRGLGEAIETLFSRDPRAQWEAVGGKLVIIVEDDGTGDTQLAVKTGRSRD